MALNPWILYSKKPGYYGDPFDNGCPCCKKVKIVCINSIINPNTYKHTLTLNKIYEAIDMAIQTHFVKAEKYNLVDDNNFRSSFDKSYFITLAEWRQNQIEEIFED